MGEKYKGKTMALSTRRRLVGEILHHARKLPSLPLARDCNIASLIAVRSRLAEPPSWIAIFMKAYALVARDRPALRRMYLSVPYPRLYEHCRSECALIVEREYQGEMVVLTGKMINIEDKSLSEIDLNIKFFCNAEVWSVSEFRQMLRMRAIPSACGVSACGGCSIGRVPGVLAVPAPSRCPAWAALASNRFTRLVH